MNSTFDESITQEELDEQLNIAYNTDGRYSDMTYEQGIVAALNWVSGYSGETPFDSDGD